MKRLLFVSGFLADTYNTIVKRYVALTAHLRDRLDMVWCLPPDDPDEWLWADPRRRGQTPELLPALHEIGATVLRLPVHRPNAVRRALLFRRLFASDRFDGVYAVFGNRFPPLYEGKRGGLVTIWDAAWPSLTPPNRYRFVKKLFYRRYIDYFVAATPFIEEELVTKGINRRKIYVRLNALDVKAIPNVDQAEARSRIRRELALPDNAYLILQLANFLPYKNVLMAVRVLKHLLAQRRDVYWILAGEDGPDLVRAQGLAARLGVESHVLFTGHRTDVWDLMAATDVVALTSVAEGLPNVLLEGMAAGRPVVTTRANGPEYAVTDGDNGYLVEPNDDMRFAACIDTLLDDPALRQAMGARGQAYVAKESDVNIWCERLGQFLLDCLNTDAR